MSETCQMGATTSVSGDVERNKMASRYVSDRHMQRRVTYENDGDDDEEGSASGYEEEDVEEDSSPCRESPYFTDLALQSHQTSQTSQTRASLTTFPYSRQVKMIVKTSSVDNSMLLPSSDTPRGILRPQHTTHPTSHPSPTGGRDSRRPISLRQQRQVVPNFVSWLVEDPAEYALVVFYQHTPPPLHLPVVSATRHETPHTTADVLRHALHSFRGFLSRATGDMMRVEARAYMRNIMAEYAIPCLGLCTFRNNPDDVRMVRKAASDAMDGGPSRDHPLMSVSHDIYKLFATAVPMRSQRSFSVDSDSVYTSTTVILQRDRPLIVGAYKVPENMEDIDEKWLVWSGAGYILKHSPSSIDLQACVCLKRVTSSASHRQPPTEQTYGATRPKKAPVGKHSSTDMDTSPPLSPVVPCDQFTHVLLCECDFGRACVPAACNFVDDVRCRCFGEFGLFIPENWRSSDKQTTIG